MPIWNILLGNLLCIIRDFVVFEIRKNLDFKKFLATPKIFLKLRGHYTTRNTFKNVLSPKHSRKNSPLKKSVKHLAKKAKRLDKETRQILFLLAWQWLLKFKNWLYCSTQKFQISVIQSNLSNLSFILI